MNKKYKLEKVVDVKTDNKIFYRIKALRDGKYFKKDEYGGLITKDVVLDQLDDSWINFNSLVFQEI